MTESESIKISRVVGAINHLIFAKVRSDSAMLDKQASDEWVIKSGEKAQSAMIELADVLEKYIAQVVSDELEKRK